MTNTINIVQASIENLDDISELFSNYRKFYGVNSDIMQEKAFIKARIANNESVIFIAYNGHRPCGFIQPYPTFSSLSISPVLILNDLYVDKKYRKRGVATQLMNKVNSFGSESFYTISLCTSKTNKNAQSLYEKAGYRIDNEFIYYSLNLNEHREN